MWDERVGRLLGGSWPLQYCRCHLEGVRPLTHPFIDYPEIEDTAFLPRRTEAIMDEAVRKTAEKFGLELISAEVVGTDDYEIDPETGEILE